MRTYVAKRGSEDIAYLLFAVIFMNGFETGGYQAALMAIGNTYGMNEAQEGLLASTELFATMIAPLILGSVADRVGKKKMLLLFTFVRVLSCFIMLPSGSTMVFAVGIFFMGFAKSIIQYVAIAAMQDTYPVTGGTKTGLITAMYATGAFVAPYVVGFAGGTALSWKMTILVDLIISAALFVLFSITDFSVREQKPIPTGDVAPQAAEPTGKIYAQGVFVLCFIMFIYVGAENGIGFKSSFIVLALVMSLDIFTGLWCRHHPSTQ